MKHLLAAAAAALLLHEAPALACSCLTTDNPVELERLAGELAKGAVALVNVEVVSGYNRTTGEGEVLRVTQILAGDAATSFRVPRVSPPFSASCDLDLVAGQSETLILYPTAGQSPSALPAYRISGLCTDHLLDNPQFRGMMIRNIAGGRPGERG